MTQPFQFPNGHLAYNADDLIELCQQFPDDGTNYLVREDLEKWLTYIGKNEIAQCATIARQTGVTDRQKLEDFLHKCHSLSSSSIPEVATTEEKVSEVSQPTIPENKINMPVETIKPVKVTQKTSESQSLTEEVNLTPPEKTEAKAPVTSPNITGEKPSFFQLVAGFIINVLYRDKN